MEVEVDDRLMGNFDERMRYLEEQVGHGTIRAGCYVNQPYAQDQHQSVWYKHPRGGRARYLGGPLLEEIDQTITELARRAITREGSDIEDAMKDFADKMADDYVGQEAPILKNVLRQSGQPYVINNGVETYHRPARAPRERDGE